MKKAFAILFASLLVTGFIACGQSEEEKKADSLREDSVKNETQDTGDSLIEMMERENQRLQDSTDNADSIAKADSVAGKK